VIKIGRAGGYLVERAPVGSTPGLNTVPLPKRLKVRRHDRFEAIFATKLTAPVDIRWKMHWFDQRQA